MASIHNLDSCRNEEKNNEKLVETQLNLQKQEHTNNICVPFLSVLQVHVNLGTYFRTDILQGSIYLVLVEVRFLKEMKRQFGDVLHFVIEHL